MHKFRLCIFLIWQVPWKVEARFGPSRQIPRYKFSLRFRVQSKSSPKIDFLAEKCAKLDFLDTSSPYVFGSNRKVHQKMTFWRKNVQKNRGNGRKVGPKWATTRQRRHDDTATTTTKIPSHPGPCPTHPGTK